MFILAFAWMPGKKNKLFGVRLKKKNCFDHFFPNTLLNCRKSKNLTIIVSIQPFSKIVFVSYYSFKAHRGLFCKEVCYGT